MKERIKWTGLTIVVTQTEHCLDTSIFFPSDQNQGGQRILFPTSFNSVRIAGDKRWQVSLFGKSPCRIDGDHQVDEDGSCKETSKTDWMSST
jgi:hypothetical protein